MVKTKKGMCCYDTSQAPEHPYKQVYYRLTLKQRLSQPKEIYIDMYDTKHK